MRDQELGFVTTVYKWKGIRGHGSCGCCQACKHGPQECLSRGKISVKFSSHFIISFIARSSIYPKVSQKSVVLDKEEMLNRKKKINTISDINLAKEKGWIFLAEEASLLWQ